MHCLTDLLHKATDDGTVGNAVPSNTMGEDDERKLGLAICYRSMLQANSVNVSNANSKPLA